MLEDIIGGYLDTLEEREFDAPFIGLLRANGYFDIHFLHGAFEFGKDFIAKKQVEGRVLQFAFQTKAGNIDLNAWRAGRQQVDDMRMTGVAHPSFDAGLPRAAVFVTTGKLVGAAAVNAQEYARFLAERGEPGFEVWDREDLIHLF